MRPDEVIIGVLGGAGPAASAAFYAQLVQRAQLLGAVEDHEFPAVRLDSPAFRHTTSEGVPAATRAGTLNELRAAIARLTLAEATVIVPVCNSFDEFWPELQMTSAVPILRLPHIAVRHAVTAGHETLGVLASNTSRAARIFESAAEQYGAHVIWPSAGHQQRLAVTIKRLMAGREDDITEYVQGLQQDGATAVILGCTELTLAPSSSRTDVATFDSVRTAIAELLP